MKQCQPLTLQLPSETLCHFSLKTYFKMLAKKITEKNRLENRLSGKKQEFEASD